MIRISSSLDDNSSMPVVLVEDANSHSLSQIGGVSGRGRDLTGEPEELKDLSELALVVASVHYLEVEAAALVDHVVNASAELGVRVESSWVDVRQVV